MTKAKVTKFILGSITIIGGLLVGEGVLSGEQLTELQNVIGLAFAGGGITAYSVVSLLSLIPISVTNNIYEKAKAKYGEEKVAAILDNLVKVPELVDAFVNLSNSVESFKAELLLNRDINAANGVYDNLSPELKERLDNIK